LTSPDLPRDEPVQPADVPAGDAAPLPAARRGWRRIRSRSALGLVTAFLIGACLCGAAGLAVGALGGHEFGHSSNEDGRGGHGRDGGGQRQHGEDDDQATPAPTTSAPATSAPATTAPASPTASASPSATS
jgi:hypothetical protein